MDSKSSCTINRTEQFEEVCSKDFLEFKFGGRGYQVSHIQYCSYNLSVISYNAKISDKIT